jgi:hypothetical protein
MAWYAGQNHDRITANTVGFVLLYRQSSPELIVQWFVAVPQFSGRLFAHTLVEVLIPLQESL